MLALAVSRKGSVPYRWLYQATEPAATAVAAMADDREVRNDCEALGAACVEALRTCGMERRAS
jgi:hypothetical protein